MLKLSLWVKVSIVLMLCKVACQYAAASLGNLWRNRAVHSGYMLGEVSVE